MEILILQNCGWGSIILILSAISCSSGEQRRYNAQQDRGKFNTPSQPRSESLLPLRRAPVCAALLRSLGGFGGGLGVTPPRRSRALCGGCGGVLGGQSVQYAAAVVGGDGLLHKGLELLLGQRDGAGQQLLDKPHALAEAVRPVLALLLFLLLD